MTRQEAITLEQVRAKIIEADRRLRDAIDGALDSLSADEYDSRLAEAFKAYTDRETWRAVLLGRRAA